ncbi:MAG: Shedu immune nuclease family protein [Bacteroidales bacterium]
MIKIQSTSRNSALGEPIILRQTTKSRLIFLPEIVNNVENPDCCVKGAFIYQVKLPSGEWELFKTLDLNKLKDGEWVKISIKTEELKKLIVDLDKYYNIYEKFGIQQGSKEFILTDDNIKPILEQILEKKGNFLKLLEKGGPEILEKLLTWLSVTSDTELVVNKLQNLKIDNLNKINSLLGVSNIKKLLELWEKNKENPDEEFWQQTFTNHSWILSQIFSHPIVILNDKAFVGGKAITDKGGKIIDFLFQNKITSNVILIEIKNPNTKLLGHEYRGVYSISEELSGTINQVLNYREELNKNYFSLLEASDNEFVSFNPKCLIIAGCIKAEINNKVKLKTLEIFRNDIKSVEVISFDELHEKISMMLNLLEANK